MTIIQYIVTLLFCACMYIYLLDMYIHIREQVHSVCMDKKFNNILYFRSVFYCRALPTECYAYYVKYYNCVLFMLFYICMYVLDEHCVYLNSSIP